MRDFVTTNENTGTKSMIRQCYQDNGDISSEFVEAGVYSYDENEACTTWILRC